MNSLPIAAMARLRIKLRPSAFLTNEELKLGIAPEPASGDVSITRPASALPVFEPVGGGMGYCLCMYDYDGVRYVTPQILDRWNMKVQEAYKLGFQFLARQPEPVLRRVGKIQLLRVPLTTRTFDPSTRLCFGIERILRIARRDPSWPSQTVIMIPNERTLILADGDDSESLSQMLRLAQHYVATRQDFLSSVPLVYTQEGWREYVAPKEFAEPFRELQCLSKAHWHAIQVTLLRTWCEKHAPRDRLAHATTVEIDSQKQWLGVWCSPSGGRDVLVMPEVDVVLFVDDRKEVCVPWDRVRAVMSHCIEDTHWRPTRWRVRGYPTDVQLALMQAG